MTIREEGKDLIKKILVALDGSEHADHALDFALDIAEKFSANIVLLSVYQLPASCRYYLEIPEDMQECREKHKAQYTKVLLEALKRVGEIKPNLKVTTILIEGRPADVIVEIAQERNFDIIVMGSRGLGGIKEFILGSVSGRVADYATCPVLIVK